MATYERVADSAKGERHLSIDQLMAIDGIARKTAKAMYEIGFQDYASLAQYLSQHTAAEVSAALKDHGVNRPPGLVDQEAWSRQAELFSAQEDPTPMPPEDETELAEKPDGSSPNRESQEHDALFTVSFDIVRGQDREPILRTTVCDGTNGDQGRVFQGSDISPWVNWMLERPDLSVVVEQLARQAEAITELSSTGNEMVTPPDPVELSDARLKISDVQLSVLGPTSGVPEKRLKAEINFQLYGSDAEELTSQGVPFRIEGYTIAVESGALELVSSDRSHLLPRVFKYVGHQEFGIPEVGVYEFHSIVLLLPPGKTATYHCGPTIRVVP
jgi:hypothetical protein